jgi:hypothetical protein
LVVALGACLGSQRHLDVFDWPSGRRHEPLERHRLAVSQQPNRLREQAAPGDAVDQGVGRLDVGGVHRSVVGRIRPSEYIGRIRYR